MYKTDHYELFKLNNGIISDLSYLPNNTRRIQLPGNEISGGRPS